MKNLITERLPRHTLTTHSDSELYIADYKNFNGGNIILVGVEPEDIKCVRISNPRQIVVCFDSFPENALPTGVGTQSQQCECLLFPDRCDEDDWALFVETKYANSIQAALNEIRGYPNKAIDQILETVKYFRDNGIIKQNKKVSAIISFPMLIEEFNSTVFDVGLIRDILLTHRIIIRGTNKATIKSEKRIELGQ
jgi:hypothetical protein